MDDDEGWWTRTVNYGGALYAARCPHCARFVKTDKFVTRLLDDAKLKEENALCSRHGRVKTPFLGWASD